jgi:transcription-repair coupling factor (superfamily II helicase)
MNGPPLASLTLGDAKKPKLFSGLQGCALSYALARFFREQQKTLLVVLPTQRHVIEMAEQLQFFLGQVGDILSFPPLGVLPYFGLTPSVDAVAGRIAFLHQLRHRRLPFLGLMSVSAIMRRLPPPNFLDQFSDYLVAGEEIHREALLTKLVEGGYQNAPLVTDPGSFSRRGGILDLYSPQMETPVRLEFFGDQLESMKSFDPETQRTVGELRDMMVLPAREIAFADANLAKAKLKFREGANEAGLGKQEREVFLEQLRHGQCPSALETYLPLFYEATASWTSYLPADYFGWWVEPEEGKGHYLEIRQEVEEAYRSCESTERVVAPADLFLAWEEMERELREKFPWQLRLLGTGAEEKFFRVEAHEALSARIQHAPLGEAMMQPLLEAIREWQENGWAVALIAGSHIQRLRLEDLLEGKKIPVQFLGQGFAAFQERASQTRTIVYLLEGLLAKGFVWPEEKLVLLTDQEIFGAKKKRQAVGKRSAEAFTTFEELSEGDFVVHEDHGLGIYHGLETLNLDGHPNDFLRLEYLGGDKLYLPIYRLNLISRYAAQEGQVPRLDRMGGVAWEKSVAKVKRELQVMAGELLQLYAQRATLEGHGFSPGGNLYEEFEATFPFEETPDQLKAIQEINRDMDQAKPMDRLICGDVGFGKTEVAMRAAFRALLDNKQVAVLVPTTVLALQHDRNFRQRFQQYPAVIETLSRFNRPKQHTEILEKIKHGKVDIVIGTHALLGKSVHFKDLGLLIVDEEHRFGVAQKEKIKKLKQLADVVALTATPIPRTLNMSLSGIRDLSVIATPPVDRMAIQTLVADYNEALIKEAIHRELARGGQVYFVHNRVQTINKVKHRLQEIIPEAKIEVGHGQMGERDLEGVMIRFLNREFNVFLCTAIVESGLDVPSANTMIVNRADTFGLAQLYQLRGRIGRSNVRAYAYLLTPTQEMLTPKAKARLAVLQRYSDLGSGFKIAAHDMEIRGAGNLLGAEQSGHIAAMGYELYLRLMEEAISEVKGETVPSAPEPELNLRLSGAIPEGYMPETPMRLTLYKRFASVQDEEELEALAEETRDRFGPLPAEVQNLMTVIRVKLLAKRAWIRTVSLQERRVLFTFDPSSPVKIDSLMALIQKEPERLYWVKPHELAMGFKEGKEDKAIDSTIQFLLRLEIAGCREVV